MPSGLTLLDVLGIPVRGKLAVLSNRVSKILVSHKKHIFASGRLDGAVVLFPAYHEGLGSSRGWRQASPEAQLSLICLLATLRSGGVAAPVTPELLTPSDDPLGYLHMTERQFNRPLLPVALTQWSPSIVCGFGILDPLLSHMIGPRTLWPGGSRDAIAHFRLALHRAEDRDTGPQNRSQSVLPGIFSDILEEQPVDLERIAVELPNGGELRYASLLSAIADTSMAPPLSSVEGVVVALLRSARQEGSRGRGGIRFPSQAWWSAEAAALRPPPPRRLPPRPASAWTAVEDTVSGSGTYFWNKGTGETAWNVPGTGRRSNIRVSSFLSSLRQQLRLAKGTAGRHDASGARLRLAPMPEATPILQERRLLEPLISSGRRFVNASRRSDLRSAISYTAARAHLELCRSEPLVVKVLPRQPLPFPDANENQPRSRSWRNFSEEAEPSQTASHNLYFDRSARRP